VRACLAVLALAWALPAAAAPAPSVDSILSSLAASAKNVTSLSGEFTQKNRIKLFKQELRSKGRLVFKPPRYIRWEYLDPDPSVLELDGNKATLSAPGAPPKVFDLEHDATMRTIFDQLLMWLSPGALDRARADYDLSATGTAEQPTLILVPKATSPIAKAFQKIELRLDGKTWLIRGILLTEKNGDEKDITFPKLDRK
jgi:outer membrane lipoprotein-sorting protein